MLYYLYILECSNNTLYTGYTTDIKRRYHEHMSGSYKCKYTRSFPPRRLAACWKITSSLSEVLKIEHDIKRLSRDHKLRLIAVPRSLKMMLVDKDYRDETIACVKTCNSIKKMVNT